MKEKLATLWAYIESQEETINVIIKRIELLKPINDDKLVNLAYQLHNLYSVYEDMFKEISSTFENNIDRSSGFHKYLLTRMKLSIPGVRQKVLSKNSYEILGELLGFRHVFRHAYNYNLSADKINVIREKILIHFQEIQNDISSFKKFLEQNFQ